MKAGYPLNQGIPCFVSVKSSVSTENLNKKSASAGIYIQNTAYFLTLISEKIIRESGCQRCSLLQYRFIHVIRILMICSRYALFRSRTADKGENSRNFPQIP